MSVLSDVEIMAEMQKDNIVISPFDQKSLSNCSYDVKLGNWIYRNSPMGLMNSGFMNPWDRGDVEAFWGKPICLDDDLLNKAYRGTIPIEDRDNVPIGNLVLLPGETVLAHTEEFIGGMRGVTTMMKCRSSLGRCCVAVCKCAGWGDIGYVNRWTMEITNLSNTTKIVLPAGARIAQIVFMYTGETHRQYQGKYQSKIDCWGPAHAEEVVQRLRDQWSPESMLPKLYKDYE